MYKKKEEDADQLFGLSAAKKGGKKGKKGSDRKAEQPVRALSGCPCCCMYPSFCAVSLAGWP